MTFKDKSSFQRHHVLSLASWARANPDYAILMYDDRDLEDYLITYLKGSEDLYASLKTPVERADLWRYVVMCGHGGIYADADTLCIRPVQVGGVRCVWGRGAVRVCCGLERARQILQTNIQG